MVPAFGGMGWFRLLRLDRISGKRECAVKALLWAVVFGLGLGVARGQVVDASVCDVVNHPMKFDGKMVRVKGVVSADFDALLVRGDSCDSALWLNYPAGTKAKSGPAAVVTMQLANGSAAAVPAWVGRPAVVLEKNADFATFDTLLSTKVKTPGMCLGCVKNDVTATLVGRVDGTDNAGLVCDASGAVKSLDGFGNLSGYPARLVLQSVSGATAQEIDFSKAPKIKDDGQGSGDKDYMKLLRGAQAAFPKGGDAAGTLDRAMGVYGAPGVDNGVTVGFGGTAELVDEGKSSKSAAGGVVFLVRFDTDKLKGDALSRAVAHEGAEIASERETSVSGYRAVEAQAWQAVLLATIGEHGKSLTLPGGIVMWNTDWPQAEQGSNASSALNDYVNSRDESPR